MLKLYGVVMSRAARSLWALEELGLKYEHVPIDTHGGSRTPEFLKINPNGHVPTLDDSGMILWESMAINLYLAEKYNKDSLWPANEQGHAAAYQWSLWAMTEVEPHLVTLLQNRMFLPPEQRNEKAAQQAAEAIKAPFKVLDDALKGKDYLLGKNFTMVDLNVASVLSSAMMLQLDLSATPNTRGWLQKCLGRPANQKVMAMMK